jgi:hypothetical protein
MAARSTTKAGDWSDPEVWSSGIVPGPGDTVTINHAVTVTDARTVGHSPGAGDATAAILVSGTGGSLTLSGPDAYLTVRGDLKLNTAVLTCTGGGVLEFDATQAATPSTARYVLQVGTANNQGTARLVVTGTDNASRFTIRSKVGGANGRITGPTSGGTRHAIQYANFLRIGDSSNNSFTSHGGSLGGVSYTIADSTFERCGVYDLTLSQTNGTWTLDRVEFKDGLHATTDVDFSLPQTKTGGARRIKQCSFSKKCVTISYVAGLEFEDNYAGPDGFSIIQSGSTWTSCRRNLIQWRSAGTTIAVNGNYVENYCLQNATTLNWHGPLLVKPVTLSDCVFESLSDDFGEADMIMGGSSAPAGTYTVRNNLFLPNQFGAAFGVGVSMLGNASINLAVNHNTFIGDHADTDVGRGVLRVGETYSGKTGQVTSLKSNLCYGFGTSGRKASIFYSVSSLAITNATQASPCVLTSNGHQLVTGTKVRIFGVTGMTELNGNIYTVTAINANTFSLQGVDSTGYGAYSGGGEAGVIDAALPADVSHNGGFNLVDGQGGSGKPGYAHFDGNGPFSDTSFGANDVDADPQFLDASTAGWRCLATFDTDYLGNAPGPAWSSSGTYAVGNIVSRTVSAIWGGKTINYRCITAHDAGTSTGVRQPGNGSSWVSYWELASEYRLRTSVAATTYAEGTPQATVRDLLEWVKEGWRPTNPAYKDAGHDGLTIGALEAVTAPPTRTGPPRFLFRRRGVASVPRFGR